jgi:predicted DNA-binding protein
MKNQETQTAGPLIAPREINVNHNHKARVQPTEQAGGDEAASSGRTGKGVQYRLAGRLRSRLRRLAKRMGITEDSIVREAVSGLVSDMESDCDVARTVAFAIRNKDHPALS